MKPASMRHFWIVMLKELRESFRDRRTVMMALVFSPLLTPLLMMGIITLSVKKETEKLEKDLVLAIAGQEHAPNLVAWLRAQGVTVKAPPRDLEAAIRNQDEDAILAIDPGYGKAWRANKPAEVEIVHDSSRMYAGTVVKRVENLLESYGRITGTLRLVVRGVHPNVVAPLRVAHLDVATPESKQGMALMFLPYILLLGAFLGGAYIAIDATAGERERQSLEPLLANPVSREAIMSGKMGAAAVFALLSVLLTMLAFKLSFMLMPANKAGIAFDLSWINIAKLFLITAPVAVLGTAIFTVVSANSKTVKEAQSWFGVLMLLPMIPTIVLMVSPVKDKLWMFLVPFLGQNQMLVRVLRGQTVSGAEWAIGLAGAALACVLLWVFASRLYRREQLAISA